MKYFLDTEFLEGCQAKRIFGIPLGKTKPTIDIISVGLVAEDGREYYAISKDFNLKEAWNRYDVIVDQVSGDMRNHFPEGRKRKVYWIRENVLKPIYYDLIGKDINFHNYDQFFTYNSLSRLINSKAKSNKQIAEEIFNFVNPDLGFPISAYNNSDLKDGKPLSDHFNNHNVIDIDGYFYARPEFYTYYGAYDHVVFCWLFGKMIDLPKGFPMYSKDLKQIIDTHFSYDNQILEYLKEEKELHGKYPSKYLAEYIMHNIEEIKNNQNYPKQENEHNALSDARWNKKLYDFLQSI